jgi:hypothetical protein
MLELVESDSSKREDAMNKKMILWTLAPALALVFAVAGWSVASDESWAIQADIAESCSCNVVCPCLFGSPSTHDFCEGSRLIEIKKGQLNGVRLDGVPVVVAFSMGKWVRYYVGGDATDEQVQAAGDLISKAFPPFVAWGIQSVEKAPVKVERGKSRMKFTAPDTVVDIKMVEGRDGKPITIQNFAPAFLDDYVQWVSEENSHSHEGVEFSHSGTNGFTSKLETGG